MEATYIPPKTTGRSWIMKIYAMRVLRGGIGVEEGCCSAARCLSRHGCTAVTESQSHGFAALETGGGCIRCIRRGCSFHATPRHAARPLVSSLAGGRARSQDDYMACMKALSCLKYLLGGPPPSSILVISLHFLVMCSSLPAAIGKPMKPLAFLDGAGHSRCAEARRRL